MKQDIIITICTFIEQNNCYHGKVGIFIQYATVICCSNQLDLVHKLHHSL